MPDTLISGVASVTVDVEHRLHIGNPPNPAILLLKMDTVGGSVYRASLTVAAARQLQKALAKTLQSLDSR